MGVDIRVCTNASYVKERFESEQDYELTHLFNNPQCSKTVKEPGMYKCATDTRIWSAPYSTYNQLRAELATMIGLNIKDIWMNPKEDTPFIELINNSDCEARFDTESCIELSKDFEAWATLAQFGSADFYTFYMTLSNAFELAANNNGCIIFS